MQNILTYRGKTGEILHRSKEIMKLRVQIATHLLNPRPLSNLRDFCLEILLDIESPRLLVTQIFKTLTDLATFSPCDILPVSEASK